MSHTRYAHTFTVLYTYASNFSALDFLDGVTSMWSSLRLLLVLTDGNTRRSKSSSGKEFKVE